MIFTGKAGGFMAEFAKLLGEVKGMDYAPIKFDIANDLSYWSAEIPGRSYTSSYALPFSRLIFITIISGILWSSCIR